MKIIYRVYEKGPGGTGFWGNYDNILVQDVCLCNSRDHFKEIMRSLYGEDLHFANSKKLPEGTPYVVIISEDCRDAEIYLTVEEHTCACCGKKFKAIPKSLKRVSTWELDRLCHDLMLKRQDEINDMVFCSEACKTQKTVDLKKEFQEYNEAHDLLPDFYVSKETFSSFYGYGYIYKITKKSTGEFYVGQTKYNPIFRWGQHLTTERFKVNNIDDYIFEVIEIVHMESREHLLAREAYWISHEAEKCPEKSLNLQVPDAEEWKKRVEEE